MAWAILGRVVRVGPSPDAAGAGAEAQAAQHAAAVGAAEAQADDAVAMDAEQEAQGGAAAAPGPEPDFTIPLVLPPRVTVLAAGRGAHPDPRNPDAYPYIIGASPHCLLVHFSVAPFCGTTFAAVPNFSNFVVVRNFQTVNGQAVTATAERISDRSGRAPIVCNIGNIVLATNDTGAYGVVELQVDTGRDRATIVYIRSTGRDGWCGKHMTSALAAMDPHREWRPHGAVFVDRTLWWFDLTWGILSCDTSLREEALVFHPLPQGRGLAGGADPPYIHNNRCVAASRNKLRYVEIIPEGEEAARVCMWSRSRNAAGDGWQWDVKHDMSFVEIWNDDSYTQTELPRTVPVLAAVCPSDPDLVYFALGQRLFGVDVPHHRVVAAPEAYEMVNFPGASPSSRFLVAWELPPAVAQAMPSPRDPRLTPLEVLGAYALLMFSRAES